MYNNQVWDLVGLPQGKKAIQNKRFFKRKIDMDGNMATYKPRLVAKGFSQVQEMIMTKPFHL